MLLKKIENIYNKSSIPTISHIRVVAMLNTYHENYRNLMKSYKRDRLKPNFQKKINNFVDNARKTLFDIAACKCKDFFNCNCNKQNKVPARERAFLLDQQTKRLGYIGQLDIECTAHMKKSMERKKRAQKRMNVTSEQISENAAVYVSESYTEESKEIIENYSSGESDDYKPTKSDSTPLSMRMNLEATSMLSDRYGLSDRSTAALASAVLQDVGIINEDDASKVIDKSKIRREKLKARYKISNAFDVKSLDSPLALYFDGRKDRTLLQVKEGAKFHRREIKEEHISLVLEPGSHYFGHLTPSSGKAISISNDIVDFLKKNELESSKIIALGCDGTVLNTGSKGGIIRLLEKKFKKALQWLPCLLHFNELPLRHLFEHLDGQTTGPRSYCGPIGKSLAACESLPIAKFKPITVKLPAVNKSNLSTDQNYLFEIMQAVSTGECSIDLSCKSPGPISHARWITTANRILRLYVGTEKPSSELAILSEFIVKVYGIGWFTIKMNPSCFNGAQNLWTIVKNSRYLPGHLRKIIDPVISRNAYFANHENILIGMLADERQNIRTLAMKRIIKARSFVDTNNAIREFVIPDLNFDAENYIDLIDWQECELTEPPVMVSISTDDLAMMVSKDDSIRDLSCYKFPCHTQSVERIVKLVTEAAAKVCGAERREGYIKSTLASRGIMASFESKSHYKIH